MVLSKFSQPMLVRYVEILVENGLLPEAQAVIALAGFGPDELQVGSTLLATWLEERKMAQALMRVQKDATRDQNLARKEAARIVSLFTRTVETLFADDEPALRTLGLRPRKRRSKGKRLLKLEDIEWVEDTENGTEANGAETNGSGPKRKKKSRSTAATIFRWRRLFANVDNLDDDHREQLAKAGWPAERIAAGAALVEAFASADTKQQEEIRAQRAQQATAAAAEIALREWYRDARKLIGLAIDDADPKDQGRLRELLGLNS